MQRSVAIGALTILLAVAALLVSAQLAPAAAPDVGLARDGRPALEFVGRVQQVGPAFTTFGYVTHVAGLEDAAIFSNPSPTARNEQTARLTFSGTATLAQGFTVPSLSGVPSTFDADSMGDLTIFFSAAPPSGRSFDVPSSFSAGAAGVATYSVHFQDSVAALVGIDPMRGVVDGWGEFCQQQRNSFTLDGQTQSLGRSGMLLLVSTHGWSVRTSPQGPQATTTFAGRATLGSEGGCSRGGQV